MQKVSNLAKQDDDIKIQQNDKVTIEILQWEISQALQFFFFFFYI